MEMFDCRTRANMMSDDSGFSGLQYYSNISMSIIYIFEIYICTAVATRVLQ